MVAFHARRDINWGPITVITPIEYNLIDVNLGGALDTLGLFTAPVSGIYYITYGHLGGTPGTNVQLHVNGAYVQQTVSETSRTASSNVVMQLNSGDTVWPAIQGDNTDQIQCQNSGGDCYFAGFLIHEILL